MHVNAIYAARHDVASPILPLIKPLLTANAGNAARQLMARDCSWLCFLVVCNEADRLCKPSV